MHHTAKDSYAETLARHKKEERELEGKSRAMVKKATKVEKAATEAKTIQMKFDLKAQHKTELEPFEDMGG